MTLFRFGFDDAAFSQLLNKFLADCTVSCLKYSACFEGSTFVLRFVISTEPACIIKFSNSSVSSFVGMTCEKFASGILAAFFATLETVS